MDKKTVFEGLLKNQYMEDLDYSNEIFSFKTLFYRSSYSFCLCSCAFEHEFLNCISETGEINPEIYERMVDNIVKGQCPHVEGMPESHIRETGVYAIHVAAAIGTENALTDHLLNHTISTTLIYNLNPYGIAIMKTNNKAATLIRKTLTKKYDQPGIRQHSDGFLYGTKSGDETKRTPIEYISALEYCVKKRNDDMLKDLLHKDIQQTRDNIANSLKLIFKHNIIDMQDDVVKYLKSIIRSNNLSILMPSLTSAIVYNRPDVLEDIISHIPRETIHRNIQYSLEITCCALRRKECQSVIEKLISSRQEHKSDNAVMKKLLEILHDFYDDFQDEVKKLLRQIPDVHEHINENERFGTGTFILPHQTCLKQYLQNQYANKEVLKTLLELGARTDLVSDREAPLTYLLTHAGTHCYTMKLRTALEVLVYANSSPEMNKSAVRLSLRIDEKECHFDNISEDVGLDGEYIMDTKEHSFFGHNRQDDYALNFLAPLLIECGFPVDRGTLLNALGRDLHPAEIEYIEYCLEQPRSLKLSCRDILRKYFKCKAIHQYVAGANIPGELADFILLKDELKLA